MFEPSQDLSANLVKWPHGPEGRSEYASLAVYLQGHLVKREDWLYVDFQIWRAKYGGQSWNIMVKDIVDVNLFPCIGDLDPKSKPEAKYRTHEVIGLQAVSDGSLDTSYKSFDLQDSSSRPLGKNCVFEGLEYSPTAEHGLIAGTMICDDWDEWRTIYCTRPTEENNRVTTCDGSKPASSCGILGKDCDKFYQLLARCRL